MKFKILAGVLIFVRWFSIVEGSYELKAPLTSRASSIVFCCKENPLRMSRVRTDTQSIPDLSFLKPNWWLGIKLLCSTECSKRLCFILSVSVPKQEVKEIGLKPFPPSFGINLNNAVLQASRYVEDSKHSLIIPLLFSSWLFETHERNLFSVFSRASQPQLPQHSINQGIFNWYT